MSARAIWRGDSQTLVSGSGDHTVRIWETQSLKNRIQARRERQAVLAQVEPMVRRLLAASGDAECASDAVKSDLSLSPRARQFALQVVLTAAVKARSSSATSPRSALGGKLQPPAAGLDGREIDPDNGQLPCVEAGRTTSDVGVALLVALREDYPRSRTVI